MNNSFESWWNRWCGGYDPIYHDAYELNDEKYSAEAAWDAQQIEIDRLREALKASQDLIEVQLSKKEGDVK